MEKSSTVIISFLAFLKLNDALKLSPVQQQIHRVDVSSEAQLLGAAFRDAYTFVHTERMKALSDGANDSDMSSSITSFDSLLHGRFVRKLKSSIDRWTVLEEKLHQSVPPASSAAFKQSFDEANNNLAANKALLGQLYIMNNQDFLGLHELQISCPTLWDYDVAIRTSYFDGWVDCYAALGHLHMKISNVDVALDLQNEMLSKMPWMRLALPTTTNHTAAGVDASSNNGSESINQDSNNTTATVIPTMTMSTANTELTEPLILAHLWQCSPLDRLSIAEQTRRVWLAARTLRAKLNDLTGEFIAAATKRRQLAVLVEAQAVVEEELIKYINSAASAAMVSDMILSSDEMSTTSQSLSETVNEENVTSDSTINDSDTSTATHSSSHQSQPQQQTQQPKKMTQADFNQLMIKPWMAEMIKDFKRQLFKEASFYLQTMDGIMEYGDAYLAPDAMILDNHHQSSATTGGDSIDTLPLSSAAAVATANVSTRPLLELFSAPVGFQSREGVRLTFEYFHVQLIEQPMLQAKASSAANGGSGNDPSINTNKDLKGATRSRSSSSASSRSSTSGSASSRASKRSSPSTSSKSSRTNTSSQRSNTNNNKKSSSSAPSHQSSFTSSSTTSSSGWNWNSMGSSFMAALIALFVPSYLLWKNNRDSSNHDINAKNSGSGSNVNTAHVGSATSTNNSTSKLNQQHRVSSKNNGGNAKKGGNSNNAHHQSLFAVKDDFDFDQELSKVTGGTSSSAHSGGSNTVGDKSTSSAAYAQFMSALQTLASILFLTALYEWSVSKWEKSNNKGTNSHSNINAVNSSGSNGNNINNTRNKSKGSSSSSSSSLSESVKAAIVPIAVTSSGDIMEKQHVDKEAAAAAISTVGYYDENEVLLTYEQGLNDVIVNTTIDNASFSPTAASVPAMNVSLFHPTVVNTTTPPLRIRSSSSPASTTASAAVLSSLLLAPLISAPLVINTNNDNGAVGMNKKTNKNNKNRNKKSTSSSSPKSIVQESSSEIKSVAAGTSGPESIISAAASDSGDVEYANNNNSDADDERDEKLRNKNKTAAEHSHYDDVEYTESDGVYNDSDNNHNVDVDDGGEWINLSNQKQNKGSGSGGSKMKKVTESLPLTREERSEQAVLAYKKKEELQKKKLLLECQQSYSSSSAASSTQQHTVNLLRPLPRSNSLNTPTSAATAASSSSSNKSPFNSRMMSPAATTLTVAVNENNTTAVSVSTDSNSPSRQANISGDNSGNNRNISSSSSSPREYSNRGGNNNNSTYRANRNNNNRQSFSKYNNTNTPAASSSSSSATTAHSPKPYNSNRNNNYNNVNYNNGGDTSNEIGASAELSTSASSSSSSTHTSPTNAATNGGNGQRSRRWSQNGNNANTSSYNNGHQQQQPQQHQQPYNNSGYNNGGNNNNNGKVYYNKNQSTGGGYNNNGNSNSSKNNNINNSNGTANNNVQNNLEETINSSGNSNSNNNAATDAVLPVMSSIFPSVTAVDVEDMTTASSHDSDSSLTTGESKIKYSVRNNNNNSHNNHNMNSVVNSNGHNLNEENHISSTASVVTIAPINNHHHHHHHQPIEIVTQIVDPQTFIAQTTDMYGNITNQNYVIMTTAPSNSNNNGSINNGGVLSAESVAAAAANGYDMSSQMMAMQMPMIQYENIASYAVYQQIGSKGQQQQQLSSQPMMPHQATPVTTGDELLSQQQQQQQQQIFHQQVQHQQSMMQQPFFYYPHQQQQQQFINNSNHSMSPALPMHFIDPSLSSTVSLSSPTNTHPNNNNHLQQQQQQSTMNMMNNGGYSYQYYQPMPSLLSSSLPTLMAPQQPPLESSPSSVFVDLPAVSSSSSPAPVLSTATTTLVQLESNAANVPITATANDTVVNTEVAMMPLPSISINDEADVISALRFQIEYYFSAANLRTDFYLRGKMDSEGRVDLEEICKFRRIRNLRATAKQILEAVRSSTKLDILQTSPPSSSAEGMNHLSADTIAILSTKIRSVDDRSLWDTTTTNTNNNKTNNSGSLSPYSHNNISRSNSPYLWHTLDMNSALSATVSVANTPTAAATADVIISSSISPLSLNNNEVSQQQ